MKHCMSAFTVLLLLYQLSTAENLTLQVGETAPDLNFHFLQQDDPGKTTTWDDFRGKVVVIDFWATWCQPCKETVPHMNHLARVFQNRPVAFLSVTYEPEDVVIPFLKKLPMSSRVAIDNDFAMFKSFRAWGIPMLVIVTPQRKVAGVINPTDLTESVLEEILQGKIPRLNPHPGWADPAGAEEYFRSTVDTSKKE